jgi:hypothetical protein
VGSGFWVAQRFKRWDESVPFPRGLYRALKDSRFVSGHRFSDAVNAAESIPASAAGQLDGWRSGFWVAQRFKRWDESVLFPRGLYRALKDSRFVSGHRFSDAVNASESIPASAAGQLDGWAADFGWRSFYALRLSVRFRAGFSP